MSFSVTCADRGLEYSSRGLTGFFAQAKQLTAPSHYGLLRQIARFNRRAPETLTDPAYDAVTVDDYLRDQRFDARFTECYLLPITSAIWSASMADVGRFPVSTIVRFLVNHGMLSMGTHPAWFVVEGGSHSYIPRMIAPLKWRVHCGAGLLAVRRSAGEVVLTFANRGALSFDHVVFACHGDQVLPLLTDPSDRERDVFSRFTTTANEVWLHTDGSLLPASPRARASWNYQVGAADAPPQVTYHLNRLQSIAGTTEYCVTLNPSRPPAESSVIRRLSYRHPQLDAGALQSQRQWNEVSGIRRTHYCGAYWRYGFHEDGVWSAVRVAEALGVTW
jgi:predicted NAD/FAD-binding protein